MSWFTKIMACISHSQPSRSCARRTARLGLELLDERAIPSANPLGYLNDAGAHLAPLGHAKALMAEAPQILFPVFAQTDSSNLGDSGAHLAPMGHAKALRPQILFPVFAQTDSFNIRGTSNADATTAGDAPAAILFPVFAQ